ncbi:RNA polymerase sigma factor [Chitinophaga alhagiae]|uniref:RNA polymerase sigma factor n=1 Tax=Chitinophaga alhagiae TaxID=2203219 RepID=UPI000E5BDBFE|nr:RNA polymerase sigma-70 factor [Chitinophaga alhagiae]
MTAYSTLTDQELTKLLAGNDNKAFETLYQRHAEALYLFAYRKLPVPHVVEDLLQDVFANIYRNRASLSGIGNFRAYLFTALRYRLLNELRNSLLHAQHREQLPTETTAEAPLRYDLHQLEKAFNAALEKFTERSREIFLLSRRDHLSYKEIADRLGISVKAVEKHMSRSLHALRHELKDYGLTGAGCVALAQYLLR